MKMRFITICLINGCFLACLSGQDVLYTDLGKYIQNPSMVAENQEPAHVTYIPFGTVRQAAEGDWEESPWYQSLN